VSDTVGLDRTLPAGALILLTASLIPLCVTGARRLTRGTAPPVEAPSRLSAGPPTASPATPTSRTDPLNFVTLGICSHTPRYASGETARRHRHVRAHPSSNGS
jgi:hypothetical protein